MSRFSSKLSKRVYRNALAWGADPRKTFDAIVWQRKFRRDRAALKRQAALTGSTSDFAWGEGYPVYSDLHGTAGAGGHYLYQDLLVAQDIFARRPSRHIDIGSSIHGFVTAVAAFREIEVIDVRPMAIDLPGVTFIQLDVTKTIDPRIGLTDSLSCLHALEHFGLGRYGDEVDWYGWRKGLSFMTQLLQPHGSLYLSVPSGAKQRVEFNAHRVFSLPFLRNILEEDYLIRRVAFVTDRGDLMPEVDLESSDAACTFGAHYGCSIWFLQKR